MLRKYICLDFEVSGISNKSFPIEVGISDPVTGSTWSDLIKPPKTWLQTGDWEEEVEEMTGITKGMLEAGTDPAHVFFKIMKIASGRTIISEHYKDDNQWMRKLAQEARRLNKSPKISDLYTVCTEMALQTGRGPEKVIQKAQDIATRTHPHCHRAGPDARFMAEIIRQVVGV